MNPEGLNPEGLNPEGLNPEGLLCDSGPKPEKAHLRRPAVSMGFPRLSPGATRPTHHAVVTLAIATATRAVRLKRAAPSSVERKAIPAEAISCTIGRARSLIRRIII